MIRWYTTLAACIALLPMLVNAQAAKPLPRLCFLTFDPGTLQSNRYGPFFDTLRQLGYIDGKTIVIDYLSAEGRPERYRPNAAECVRRNADVIVVSTTPLGQEAKKATKSIPIVMTGLIDPVSAGLVDDLARPGGNVTGLTIAGPQVAAKRLELLKELAPKISRVLLLTYSADPAAAPQIQASTKAARSLGITLLIRDIASSEDFAPAFKFAAAERATGVVRTAESIFTVNRGKIIELAAKYKMPAVYGFTLAVADGGLMSYTADYRTVHAQVAVYVDKILKGAKPADLPIEQPTKFDLGINLKTAKALGITVPQTLLLRADRIIQ